MFGIDWEAAGYRFCDFISWTAPRPLAHQANLWRWEWKAMTGTIYPEGVFILAFYLAFLILLLAIATALRKGFSILADRRDSAQNASEPSARRSSRRSGAGTASPA